MRAVINTSAPSLGEKGTKTIEYLKRQMVLMEEDNMKLYNKKNITKKIFQNPSKIGKILRLCLKLQLTIKNR